MVEVEVGGVRYGITLHFDSFAVSSHSLFHFFVVAEKFFHFSIKAARRR